MFHQSVWQPHSFVIEGLTNLCLFFQEKKLILWKHHSLIHRSLIGAARPSQIRTALRTTWLWRLFTAGSASSAQTRWTSCASRQPTSHLRYYIYYLFMDLWFIQPRTQCFCCGQIHYGGTWEGIGPWKSRLFWALFNGIELFVAQKSWDFHGPTLPMARVINFPKSKKLHTGLYQSDP